MAMKSVLATFLSSRETSFAVFLLIAWMTTSACFVSDVSPVWQVVFVLVSALATFVITTSLGYFDGLRLVPRWSDLLIVSFGVPIGAGIGRFGVGVFGGVSLDSPLKLVGLSSAVALCTFGAHAWWCRALVRWGHRRTIALAVAPAERESIVDSAFTPELRSYVDFVELSEVRTALDEASGRAIDLIIISRLAAREFDAEGLLLRAHLAGIPIVDERRIRADLSGRIRVDGTDMWTYLLEATPQTPLLRLFAAVKVGSEPILACILGLALAPIFLVLCILIPWTSRGPIFYRQTRTGYLGQPFSLVKFRSMRIDAEAQGLRWASDNDERTTRLGRFMRRTRLDELPQLWNVIRGEMSFCGPRPERPEVYTALAQQIPLFPLRTLVRPGITGWAQVYAGYAASVEESALKLEYDLYYIQNLSPRLDLIVLAKTVAVALCGDARGRSERSLRDGIPIQSETL
jgi:lipopolysaccharide/colanic/teichoic acid biosynthesis glycosyltransferase